MSYLIGLILIAFAYLVGHEVGKQSNLAELYQEWLKRQKRIPR